jgi:hypothetical protein
MRASFSKGLVLALWWDEWIRGRCFEPGFGVLRSYMVTCFGHMGLHVSYDVYSTM